MLLITRMCPAFLKVLVDSHVIKAFEWLGLFDTAAMVPPNTPNTLDALSWLMRSKMVRFLLFFFFC